MFTENGVEPDLAAVDDILRRGDVIAIGFTGFAERLLVDTRFNDETGPLATVVEPVASVQERFLWLGRHRGMFGAPKAFSFFVWPGSVATLVHSDVLDPLRARLAAYNDEAVRGLAQALGEMVEGERDLTRRAIRGDEPWKSLWERTPAA